jgi:phosphatidate cytidylyltransferase
MKRVITAAIGVPLIVLLTLRAPDWLFALVIAAAGASCLEELLALGAARLDSRPGRWVLLLGAGVTLSFSGGVPLILTALTFSVLIAATVTSFSASLQEALPKLALTLMGILYCGLLPGFLLLMDRKMIIVLLGILWIGDTAAFYGGRFMGRHLLAPSISPRKTIEGAFAGLIASIIAGVVLGFALTGQGSGRLVAASLVSGCAGQLGDLAESALKRSAGVKDSSSLLPGHGGMLDRLDGLLFAAPVYYWFFR